MNSIRATVAGLAALSLSACASGPSGLDYNSGREVGGALIGAAAGGLLGAQFGRGSGKLATTAAGTLAGAFVGASIGRSLDRRDRYYAQTATERALEGGRPGETIEWNNPETGNYGAVRMGRTYSTRHAPYCREFEQTVYIGGRPQSAFGTACRQPDGDWRIVS